MHVIEVSGLGKDYGARAAVGSVDLTVDAGEIVGLLGPNGAGKTTTIAMIAGIVTPGRGTARIGGHDVRRERDAARRALGYVPQELALYEDLSPRQNLEFFGALYGLRGGALADGVTWALAVAGLADRGHDPVRTFSGGMKRRLNLAVALIHRPRAVILDEPTVGVDPHSRQHLFAAIRSLQREHGIAVLYTSHYMEEVAALCSRVTIMDHGAVVAAGPIEALIAGHGHTVIELTLDRPAAPLVAVAARFGEAFAQDDVLRVTPRAPRLGELMRALEDTGAVVRSAQTRAPDLESVFLALTGHSLRDPDEA